MEGSNCSSCGNEAVAHSTGYGMKDHPLNLPGVHYMIFEKNIGHIRGIKETWSHQHKLIIIIINIPFLFLQERVSY